MGNQTEIISKIIRERYGNADFIPLHSPYFGGNEKKYLNECIDSTFVSSVGAFVDQFEAEIRKITGSKFAIAVVNGTSALHTALILAGVKRDDEVISQSLTFVATTNAISYIGANPVFIDVDKDTLGLSPEKLADFLAQNTHQDDAGNCVNNKTGRVIRACVPMHTFGLALRIEELVKVCRNHNIKVVEDAAESLGTYVDGKHTGVFGDLAVFSFNGNKVATSGGGGAIITNDDNLGKLAKHITTTAKTPHPYEFFHDQVGYNYRMPNINAALAVAQLEQLDEIVANKRETAQFYHERFLNNGVNFVAELENTKSNYWLNTVLLDNETERDSFLHGTNQSGIMTRPIWTLMNKLPAFEMMQCDDLSNSEWLEKIIVNIPSSFISNK